MENKQELPYKKIKLGILETNHHGYTRLLREFDEKLAKSIAKDKQLLATERKFDVIINELGTVAANVREKIEDFRKVSEPDAIQALACLGKALDDPSTANMNQLNALITTFNSFRASDEKQAAVTQQRKALAIGLSSFVFYLATITAAIMIPLVIPMLLVIVASIALPVGYFYSKSNLSQGQRKEQLADDRQKSSNELGASMKILKEALPKAELNKEGEPNTLKRN